jgi:hypothetical protein
MQTKKNHVYFPVFGIILGSVGDHNRGLNGSKRPGRPLIVKAHHALPKPCGF